MLETGVFCEQWEIFQSTYFEEYLPAAAHDRSRFWDEVFCQVKRPKNSKISSPC